MAIRKVARDTTQCRRPVFAVSWDPRLPYVSVINQKHWQSLTKDLLMKETFPDPPLIAYLRQKNIEDMLIRVKTSPKILLQKRKTEE